MQAYDFVVADVKDEKVRRFRGAVACCGKKDVRINAPHGGIDNLELLLRKCRTQHEFEDAGKAEGRLGCSLGSGFPEHKNTDCASRFFQRNQKRLCFPLGRISGVELKE